MRRIKKLLVLFGISILAMILLRGSIFRLVVKYNDVGNRSEVRLTDKSLIDKIENRSENGEHDLDGIVALAREITDEELTFTTSRASGNPNELFRTKRANCVGYAAMFNSIANYLIRKHQLQDELKAEHKVGQLDLLGIDLHQFFDSPFFRDHDYNLVVNKATGEIIAIDPTVSDYLWIGRVSERD